MKNKTISSKIETLSNRIKSIKSKAENAKNLNESGTFKSLESDLEATIVLKNEVQKLKDLLKTKTQELEVRIAKLKKGSKAARKTLKKENKTINSSGKDKNRLEKFSAISKIPDTKKNMVKSKKKSTKNKK
jgi:hypothetical protein